MLSSINCNFLEIQIDLYFYFEDIVKDEIFFLLIEVRLQVMRNIEEMFPFFPRHLSFIIFSICQREMGGIRTQLIAYLL